MNDAKEKVAKKYNKIVKYIPYMILLMIVLIISLVCLYSSPLFPNLLPEIDSSVFQVMGKGLLENKIMYKDLFDHKGPVVYFINAIAFLINSNCGLFVVEFIIAYVGTIYVYKTSKIILNKTTSTIISIIYIFMSFKYFEGGNYTEEYAITFISMAMYYIIKILQSKENKKINWIMIGTTFAITFMIKPTYCTIWAVFGVVQLISSIKDKKITELLKAIVYMIFGTAIIIIPIIIYLIINSAMDSFIDAYFIMNIKYSESTIIEKIKGLLKLFYIYKYTKILVIMAISNFIILISKKVNKRTKIFITLFLIISTILTGWSPTAYNHYLIQLSPCFILEVMFALYIISNIIKEKIDYEITNKLPLKLIFIMPIICLILVIGTNLILLENRMKRIDSGYKNFRKKVSEIENYINEDDEILVLENNSYYYLIFNKIPNTKYFFQTPIIKYDEKIKNETEKYIIEKKPKVIINEIRYSKETVFERDVLEQKFGKVIYDVITQNYEYHSLNNITYYVLKGEE